MKKILVIEDDQFLNKLLKTKLESAGFSVVVSETGTKALIEAENNSYDLILLDLIIPDKDGFEVLKSIKSFEKSKSTPVIITSNLSQSEDINRTKEMGAVGYMVKSDSSLGDIVTKIQRTLEKSTVSEQT